MNPHQYPSVWPQLIPALEAALQQYEQARMHMADFKKKYASAKNKAKRAEKYLTAMDETTRKWYEYRIVDCLRLAENKFILIDKKLQQFQIREERYCKDSLKLLKASKAMDPNMTAWHIQCVAGHLGSVNSLLHTVGDMLRIAKGHLAKVNDAKKQLELARKRGWLK